MYDVIIVGGRCAGSPTAMLLAQKGYKVLLVDRSTFPSDTISTHCIWPPGASRLKRWGLLDKVAASNCPLIEKVSLDFGPFVLSGSLPPYDGVSDCYAPRRTVLDKILIDAAADAGADVREGCAVSEIVMDDGKVTGIRCHTQGGSPTTENARIVVGADGRNSVVARSVNAEKYNVKPSYACWYYTYWSGVPRDGVEFYLRPEHAIGYLPTNDGRVCIPIGSPFRDFEHLHSDVEGNYMGLLSEHVPELADRLRQGKREERFYGLGEVPNFFRRSHGRGWALVGDAGYHKDPIGAQGISDAFRDAENLADALHESFAGSRPIEEALGEYEERRNEEAAAMYEFNSQMASLEPPPPEMLQLISALRGNQADTDRYLGVIAGTVPVREFFSPENTQRIMAAAA
jgi:2-polyprenyl-6-methoxyphenol hydroxylase-like FAD-dependent oxidoreductase